VGASDDGIELIGEGLQERRLELRPHQLLGAKS